MKFCECLENCPLFRRYRRDENKKYALIAFIEAYCKGERQTECVRKKVSRALGGPDKVPTNMMPSGLPVFGTLKDNWSDEVKALL
ncbi:MAG: hypothetical protein PVH73_08860 [Candidatus Bathyarchaeota archaeon]|jgi:hypothetical protein